MGRRATTLMVLAVMYVGTEVGRKAQSNRAIDRITALAITGLRTTLGSRTAALCGGGRRKQQRQNAAGCDEQISSRREKKRTADDRREMGSGTGAASVQQRDGCLAYRTGDGSGDAGGEALGQQRGRDGLAGRVEEAVDVAAQRGLLRRRGGRGESARGLHQARGTGGAHVVGCSAVGRPRTW